LFAIDIIDTQVVQRGRQYHRNPSKSSYKKEPYLKKRIKIVKNKIKTHTHKTPPPNPTHHPSPPKKKTALQKELRKKPINKKTNDNR
jgi:hypothetical protein